MSKDKGIKLEKENYTIEVKYSKEAIEKKLVKFITKSGDEIVISAEELISMLVNQVNSDLLSPTFVDVEKINVVEVGRQIKCKLEKDMKAGEEININYFHPYPLEFALIEEMYKIAKVTEGIKVFELTNEFIEETKKKILPEMEKFTEQFYKSIKSVELKK